MLLLENRALAPAELRPASTLQLCRRTQQGIYTLLRTETFFVNTLKIWGV